MSVSISLLTLTQQVGYHNEHHDFPSVPWTRLPELHRIAHEFYDPLPSHASWPYVTWKFITDPSVGMWCRAKREGKGDRLHESVWVNGSRCVSRKSEDVYMEEEDERGYASDRDEQTKRKKA